LQAEELNSIVGNAFRMAYAAQLQRQPTFQDVIASQLHDKTTPVENNNTRINWVSNFLLCQTWCGYYSLENHNSDTDSGGERSLIYILLFFSYCQQSDYELQLFIDCRLYPYSDIGPTPIVEWKLKDKQAVEYMSIFTFSYT
jgi:hypothetical protein